MFYFASLLFWGWYLIRDENNQSISLLQAWKAIKDISKIPQTVWCCRALVSTGLVLNQHSLQAYCRLLTIIKDVLTVACSLWTDCVLFVSQWIMLSWSHDCDVHKWLESFHRENTSCICDCMDVYVSSCDQMLWHWASHDRVEPTAATWWLTFAKTHPHVLLSDTAFKKDAEIQYTNGIALCTLMHHHMGICTSVFIFPHSLQ